MRAKSTFANHDSPSKRSFTYHFLSRNAKRVDMNDAKVALDIIMRPSLQLWKQVLGRSGVFTTLKRPRKTTALPDYISTPSSVSLKKKVRFDDKPITISRRSFLERLRKDSCSSPARPCLIMRDDGDAFKNSLDPPPETDCPSVYEDCLSDYSGFLVDLEVFEDNQCRDTRWPKRIRRSEFYQMESGIAMFDQAGYASYCLSRWLDRQREETRSPKKCVFEDPGFLSQPTRALPLPPLSTDRPDTARPISLPSAAVCLSIRSLPRHICNYIEDELQNAIVVLVVGIFIHICLFLFLVYDVLTRGLSPSDD